MYVLLSIRVNKQGIELNCCYRHSLLISHIP
jgi:hypothetical protein